MFWDSDLHILRHIVVPIYIKNYLGIKSLCVCVSAPRGSDKTLSGQGLLGKL